MISDATLLIIGVLLLALFIQEWRVRHYRAEVRDLDQECDDMATDIRLAPLRRAIIEHEQEADYVG